MDNQSSEEPVVSKNPDLPVASVLDQPKKRKFVTLAVGSQLPLVLALLIIAGMLAIWRPWETTGSTNRTITVTGEAEVTAEPDEYTFSPSYQFKGDAKTALADANAKINGIVTKLKDLGVADKQIKTDTYGYQSYYNEDNHTYYASVTVVIDKKDLAQKVQDYLLNTTPSGSVTPQADFSKSKRAELTNNARDLATKNARAKADQSAKNLGFKVGKVKSVHDEPDNSFFRPYASGIEAGVDSATNKLSSPIQQGQDDLNYEVTVTYFLD